MAGDPNQNDGVLTSKPSSAAQPNSTENCMGEIEGTLSPCTVIQPLNLPSLPRNRSSESLDSKHESNSCTDDTSFSAGARATAPPHAPTPFPSPTTRLLTEAHPTTSTTDAGIEGMPPSLSSLLAEHAQQQAEIYNDHMSLHHRVETYAQQNRELHHRLEAANNELARCKRVLDETKRAAANPYSDAETSLRNALKDEINRNFDNTKRYHEAMKSWEAITAKNKSKSAERISELEQTLEVEEAEHQRELDEEREAHEKAARENEIARNRNRILSERVEHLTKHNDEVKVKLLHKESEIVALREQIKRLKVHVLAVEAKLGGANKEKKAIKAKMGTYGKENTERLKERLQIVSTSLTEAEQKRKNETERHKNEVKKYQSKVEEHKSEVEKHKNEVEEHKSHEAKYESEMEALNQRLAHLTAANKKLRDKLRECKKHQREEVAAAKAAGKKKENDPETADTRLRQRVNTVVDDLCSKIELLSDVQDRATGLLGDEDVSVLLSMTEVLKQLAALGEE